MSPVELPQPTVYPFKYNNNWLFRKALTRIKNETSATSLNSLKALAFGLPLLTATILGVWLFAEDIKTWIISGLIEGTLLLVLAIWVIRRSVYNDAFFVLQKTDVVDEEERLLVGKLSETKDEEERAAHRHHIEILKNLRRALTGEKEKRLLKELYQLTNSWAGFHRTNLTGFLLLILLAAGLTLLLLQHNNTYPVDESLCLLGLAVLWSLVAYVLAVELYWEKSDERKRKMLDLLETELIRLNKGLDRLPSEKKEQRNKLIEPAQTVHIFLAGKRYNYEPLEPHNDEHLQYVARVTTEVVEG